MSTSKRHSRVAYLEEAEEDSGSSVEGIEGTRQYATSVAPASPAKEQPNTSKSRVDRRPPTSQRTSGTSSPTVNLTDSDSGNRPSRKGREPRRSSQQSDDQAQPDYRDRDRDRSRRRRERALREKEEDRRRDESAARDRQKERERERTRERESKSLKKVRPPVIKHQTQPVIQQSSYRRGHVEDPAAYGIQPAASNARPRAQTRPASYYAGQSSRPPIANMGWHQTQHPPPFPVGTFAPQQHLYPGASPAGYGPPPPHSPTGPPGYFDAAPGSQQNSHLKQRFESRPSSAMGHQSPSGSGYADDYIEESRERLSRRPSRSRRTEDDRKRMPPPEFIPSRPQSAVPSTPFRAPPPQHPQARQNASRAPPSHRRSVGFVDQQRYEEDYVLDDGLFQDSPESSYDQRRTALVRRPRRESFSYEQSGYDIVPAGARNRRASMYGAGAVGSNGVSPPDNRYQDALKYQEEVSGAQMPLTAETLRKASKRGGVPSSRSTRSSGSRDDSEYKRSNTTGITRSSSGNNDDVTIKVSGGAVVRFPGAEIECNDGGEITFSRPQGGSRSGSDRASTVYPIEDARSRMERKALTQRPRAPSQSDSQSRGHAPGYAPYDTSFAPANFF